MRSPIIQQQTKFSTVQCHHEKDAGTNQSGPVQSHFSQSSVRFDSILVVDQSQRQYRTETRPRFSIPGSDILIRQCNVWSDNFHHFNMSSVLSSQRSNPRLTSSLHHMWPKLLSKPSIQQNYQSDKFLIRVILHDGLHTKSSGGSFSLCGCCTTVISHVDYCTPFWLIYNLCM
jgi:hypothetical protein